MSIAKLVTHINILINAEAVASTELPIYNGIRCVFHLERQKLLQF